MDLLRLRLTPNYDSSARSGLRGELLGTGFVRKIVRLAPDASELGSSDILLGGIAGELPGWMPHARAEFIKLADRLGTTQERWIWPIVGGAISDAPSVLSFLRARPNWRFALCAADVLTPECEPGFEDLVRRLLEAIAGHPQMAVFVVSSSSLSGGRCSPAMWGSNPRFEEMLRRFAMEFLHDGVQFCVLEGDDAAVEVAKSIHDHVARRSARNAAD